MGADANRAGAGAPLPGRDAEPAQQGRAAARATILALLSQRSAGATICPSEAARALAGDEFRPLMNTVREAAGELVCAGSLEVTQHGEPVDIQTARGPIRLRLVRPR